MLRIDELRPRAHDAISRALDLRKGAEVALERSQQLLIDLRSFEHHFPAPTAPRRPPTEQSEAEISRLLAEIQRLDERHADEVANLRHAIESRDLIGQAKGVIIAASRCSADEAFEVLREQSQHQNRKLAEIAAEIVRFAQRR
jgi:hypothetical protein